RPGEPILKDLSFTVAAGRKIAIVGPTGSGKTTIIKLLNRSYDVTSGRILVDGVDVREWDLAALRREIGYVQQDVFLFAGDVMENIRLGLELGESEVRDSLRRAQALRFVERLPGGLAEEIRERGANLSAGQRQLLSFARALAYNPRILVMDEATSSVDSETERLIQLALNELLAERTAVVIAHRLSTIERADRIMVLGGGVLRESGTHDELLAQRGLYYRLFELQYAAMANSDRLVAGGRRPGERRSGWHDAAGGAGATSGGISAAPGSIALRAECVRRMLRGLPRTRRLRGRPNSVEPQADWRRARARRSSGGHSREAGDRARGAQVRGRRTRPQCRRCVSKHGARGS